MRRTNADKPPYLSLCLIIRNCAATLEQCLVSIRKRAPEAEIVCVDTCSRDDSGIDVFFEKKDWNRERTDDEISTLLAGEGLKLEFIDEHPLSPFRGKIRIRSELQDEVNP